MTRYDESAISAPEQHLNIFCRCCTCRCTSHLNPAGPHYFDKRSKVAVHLTQRRFYVAILR
ncbi:hypothetical protein Plhal304r1_c029g0096521 [Plasmopara halstedii]